MVFSVIDDASTIIISVPLARTVPKSLVELFSVMALPVATKLAVPETVIAVPVDCVIDPPVEFTDRLLDEIVPSAVALVLTIVTSVPLAAILPADENILVVLMTVMALPVAINCELPVTEIPVPVACAMAPPVEFTDRLVADIVPSLVTLELTNVRLIPQATIEPFE